MLIYLTGALRRPSWSTTSPTRTRSLAPRPGSRNSNVKHDRTSWSPSPATSPTWATSGSSSTRRPTHTPRRTVSSSWRPRPRTPTTSTRSSWPSRESCRGIRTRGPVGIRPGAGGSWGTPPRAAPRPSSPPVASDEERRYIYIIIGRNDTYNFFLAFLSLPQGKKNERNSAHLLRFPLYLGFFWKKQKF